MLPGVSVIHNLFQPYLPLEGFCYHWHHENHRSAIPLPTLSTWVPGTVHFQSNYVAGQNNMDLRECVTSHFLPACQCDDALENILYVTSLQISTYFIWPYTCFSPVLQLYKIFGHYNMDPQRCVTSHFLPAYPCDIVLFSHKVFAIQIIRLYTIAMSTSTFR